MAPVTPRRRRSLVDTAWLAVPLVVALAFGSQWGLVPWYRPPMEDLMVYRRAASALLAGQDPYQLTNSFPFIYPPFAALLSLVLAPMSGPVMKVGWTALNVWAAAAVLGRAGMRGWQRAVVTAAVITLAAPFGYTFALGQLGILLMAACLVDVLDGDPAAAGVERRERPRWLPCGVLVGLAAGVKLTPAVFLILFWLVGRRRDAIVGGLTFLATVALGFVGLFRPAVGYWTRLSHGDSGANPDAFGWLFNQSVLSGWQRFFGVASSGGGLALSGLVVLLGLAAAWRGVRAGQPWLAVGLLGLASSLANPIAWVHHMTWILPLAVGAWRSAVPHLVRFPALAAALWWCWEPFDRLPGAPWAQAEQFAYSISDKFLACGGAIACAVALVVAIATPWRAAARAEAPAPAPEPSSGATAVADSG